MKLQDSVLQTGSGARAEAEFWQCAVREQGNRPEVYGRVLSILLTLNLRRGIYSAVSKIWEKILEKKVKLRSPPAMIPTPSIRLVSQPPFVSVRYSTHLQYPSLTVSTFDCVKTGLTPEFGGKPKVQNSQIQRDYIHYSAIRHFLLIPQTSATIHHHAIQCERPETRV